MNNYGEFTNNLGGYKYDKLPSAGLLEYFLKNEKFLLKLDQYGVNFLQHDAPSGIIVCRRERRENTSPLKVLFDINGKVFNNFDVVNCESFSVEYMPTKAIYSLSFGEINVVTTLMIFNNNLLMDTRFINKSGDDINLKLMPVLFQYMTDANQAVWDKVEWYTRTYVDKDDENILHTKRFSVSANKSERRLLTVLFNHELDSCELSLENLLTSSKNLSYIPDKMLRESGNDVYGVEQVISGIKEVCIKANQSLSFKEVIHVDDNDLFDKKDLTSLFSDSVVEEKLVKLNNKFNEIFSSLKIKTKDEMFNNFINGFLPLEISWVADLDRGWGTGLRGVRDAANDFMGYLYFNHEESKKVIENILSKQRNDGWYPRQVGFGTSKMDLREFMDSGCFFFEFIYEYLCYTDDYSILDKKYPYYNSEVEETGFEHIKKGVEFLMKQENLGVHGLVKLNGGDWLDCLNGVGKEGRAETVMVSAQMILTLQQYIKILSIYKPDEDIDKYEKFISMMKENINKYSYNNSGFYNAIFGDDGHWYLSEMDVDGKSRVYGPTNSYCLLTGVAEGKEEQVIKNIETLKSNYGYKLFSHPFGIEPIEGMGKMGTGDFQPLMCENGSVYNHGSQCFYLRALSKLGKYDLFGEVMDYALPLYRKEEETCGAKYAITNCYQLIPGFEGRQLFSFLTGTIAMIIRAVYNWMFGIQFEPTSIMFAPCIPEKYKDASINFEFLDKKIYVEYSGFGSKIKEAFVNNNRIDVVDGKISIKKTDLNENTILRIIMENL